MKNKLKFNPILRRELMVGSRSIKISLLIMGINLFLGVIVVFAMFIAQSSVGNYDYRNLLNLFPILCCLECAIISLVVPVFTSNSISGERERQTLDIMLTTPIKPMAVVLGKLEIAVVVTMLFIISSLPVLAISFVLGGMNWISLFIFVLMMLYLGIYIGSIGIFCSSVVRKSVYASILTIAIGIGIIVVTAVIFGIWVGVDSFLCYQKYGDNYTYKYGASLMVFLLNPYAPGFDFLVRAMSSESVYSFWKADGVNSMILSKIYQLWIPISMVLNMGVSYLFLKAASISLNSSKVKKKKGKRNVNE